MPERSYDLVIVGMGSAGMVAAEFASTLDIKVAAVERDRVGGDCLWTGCVPSKALLASAKAANTMRHADRYGLTAVEPEIDTARVFERIRSIQADLAATDDSPDRFTEKGVDVHFGAARLTSPETLEIEGVGTVRSRFFLLCTGSRPATPPVPGLREAGFLTSESVWQMERAPKSLLVIGGGPISMELSQGFARLGVETTVLERSAGVLSRDEPELAARLAGQIRNDGVQLVTDVELETVALEDGVKVVRGRCAGAPGEWRAAEIFVGAGRRPNVEGLGLEEVGVEASSKGVVVDGSLRSSVRSIYAAGDVAGRFLFTHSAGYEAAAAIRNMFFPASSDAPDFVPWCTYTDPELAHAGLTEAQARERDGDDVHVWRHDLEHSDRARTDSAPGGEIRIVTAKGGRIVGAHALMPNAGEVIHELALAIYEKKKLSDLGSLVHVYPTLSMGIGQLAGEASYARAGRLGFLVRSKA
jgi:pyruvate/2-oxoglutarate dehydrogenase complex dihydrolipoamide dehydrogenase (E3) component